ASEESAPHSLQPEWWCDVAGSQIVHPARSGWLTPNEILQLFRLPKNARPIYRDDNSLFTSANRSWDGWQQIDATAGESAGSVDACLTTSTTRGCMIGQMI